MLGNKSADVMKSKSLSYSASALLFALVGGCASKAGITATPLRIEAQAPSPHYDIDFGFTPGDERWTATVRAAGLPCRSNILRIYLHRDIVIANAVVDERSLTPILDPPGADRFWISASRAIDLPCPKQGMSLTYDGPAKLHEDGRNQVTADLIELSLYGAWYPLISVEDRATWTLTTRLPPDWQYASPARIEDRVGADGRVLRLTSREPGDVVFVASPHFDVATVVDGTAAARVFVNRRLGEVQLETAQTIGRDGADMAAWLQDVLGASRLGEDTRPDIVFTLRGGPLSYSRLPVIVLREKSLVETPERSERLNVRHEVAHFWSVAKGAQNDWINEGLAEYLAVVQTGDMEGETMRVGIIADYRAQVASAGAGDPLVTAGDDARGFINRYVRPTLMLDAVEQRAGWLAMEAFLRKLTAAGEALDTGNFVRIAAETLGDTEAETITRCLEARDWPVECGGR